MKKVDLQGILDEKVEQCGMLFSTSSDKVILSAMKEACRQVLELAAENAKVKSILKTGGHDPRPLSVNEVDKQSILNTLNQVE